MKMEHTGCSKMSAHKIQTPGNHPKERIQQFRTRRRFEIGKCALAMYDTDHCIIMYITFSKSEI